MIVIHLSTLLGKKRMTQRQLSELTGIRPNTISDLYNDIAVRVGLEQLDKICEVLDCELSELIERVPNKVSVTGNNLIIEEHGNRKKK